MRAIGLLCGTGHASAWGSSRVGVGACACRSAASCAWLPPRSRERRGPAARWSSRKASWTSATTPARQQPGTRPWGLLTRPACCGRWASLHVGAAACPGRCCWCTPGGAHALPVVQSCLPMAVGRWLVGCGVDGCSPAAAHQLPTCLPSQTVAMGSMHAQVGGGVCRHCAQAHTSHHHIGRCRSMCPRWLTASTHACSQVTRRPVCTPTCACMHANAGTQSCSVSGLSAEATGLWCAQPVRMSCTCGPRTRRGQRCVSPRKAVR